MIQPTPGSRTSTRGTIGEKDFTLDPATLDGLGSFQAVLAEIVRQVQARRISLESFVDHFISPRLVEVVKLDDYDLFVEHVYGRMLNDWANNPGYLPKRQFAEMVETALGIPGVLTRFYSSD